MTTIDSSNYKNTNSKILIECDLRSSDKCKGVYLKSYRYIIKSRNKNSNKDICTYCYNKSINIGKRNGAYVHNKNHEFFEDIDTELKAYLLGLIAGDGSIDKSGKRITLYSQIIPDVESLHLLRNAVCPSAKIFNDEGTGSIKINSVKIVDDVCRHLKLSPGKKSYKVSIPDLNHDLIRHFIRGLMDSDGCIVSPLAKCTSPRCKITSYSYKMKKEIGEFCDDLSINNYINDVDIYFSGQYAMKFMSLLYDDSSFSLTRKRCLYKMWSTWVPYMGTAFKKRKPYTIHT